jgi:hypothetical protein
MSYVRFNHVFGLLLVVSAVCAFVIPEKLSRKPLPGLQGLFAPVSFPARRFGAWAHDRIAPPDLAGKRTLQAVLAENDRLTNYVGSLQKQLEIERRRNAEWAPLAADVRERCIAVAVGGADAGPRESLALPPSSLQRVREGAFALYPGGVAGQVQGGSGLGGAQLRLITDPGFKLQGRFVRKDPAGGPKLVQSKEVVLLEGVGKGAMLVRAAFTWEEVQKGAVQVGDAALLEDRDWPPDLHGQRLGVVTRVEPMREQHKFAEIRVEPTTNLMMLNEVMVFTK